MSRGDVEQLGLRELLAIGVGGMIGGGIFSVMGIAAQISGHAAPLAFGLGGLIALLAGYSYVRLALTYRSDGASFTYLERAFPHHPNVGGLMGWIVIIGYIGTLALYAFTFGAYGADLVGAAGSGPVRIALSVGVLVLFMFINLRGVRASGVTEDLTVLVKVILLAIFGLAGLITIRRDRLTPVFDEGVGSIFVAGAMIFVAFEGFQLITNAVCETRNPDRNIPRGIYGAIAITTVIYLLVSVVAIGNLTAAEIVEAEEYTLAVAARPVLGEAGRILVGLAALLATSSAINATAFGASRMMAEMATERMLPRAFSFRSREAEVPWVAVVVFMALGVVFTVVNSLETIAVFSSLTFLLVSLGVGIANLRLRRQTRARSGIVLAGVACVVITILLLVVRMSEDSREALIMVGVLYGVVFAAELLFSKRRLVWRNAKTD